jgi:hypothetical protein
MKCDLCEHQNMRSKNKLLCEDCAEMIQRLLIVQQRMDSHEPGLAATAAA